MSRRRAILAIRVISSAKIIVTYSTENVQFLLCLLKTAGHNVCGDRFKQDCAISKLSICNSSSSVEMYLVHVSIKKKFYMTGSKAFKKTLCESLSKQVVLLIERVYVVFFIDRNFQQKKKWISADALIQMRAGMSIDLSKRNKFQVFIAS